MSSHKKGSSQQQSNKPSDRTSSGTGDASGNPDRPPIDRSRILGAEEPQRSLSERVMALLDHQRKHWPMLVEGYESLKTVETRSFEFDGFVMTVQCNPGRIVSSSAKVDDRSIRERRCFLCMDNLPSEQRGVDYGDYILLCNPFPIFRDHLTIAHMRHIPQRIRGAFGPMLDLARGLGERFTLFYNGPRCGASAPDHLHFQAGERGFMPMDIDWERMVDRQGEWVIDDSRLRAARVDDGLRRYVILESGDKAALEDRFERLYRSFAEVTASMGGSRDTGATGSRDTGTAGSRDTGTAGSRETKATGNVGTEAAGSKATGADGTKDIGAAGSSETGSSVENEGHGITRGNRGDEEPMLNILVSREPDRWRVIVFLRRKHRPDRYFLEGEEKMVFSPAAVDFGGVCILPVRRDFERITAGDLRSMFREVSAGPQVLDEVVRRM